MSKNLNFSTEQELDEIIQSLMEENPNMCFKCGHKLIQQYKTEWNNLSTEIKMKCHQCGHAESSEKKLLS